MTTVKEWLTEAAKEVAANWPEGKGRDDYVTDEQRQNVADNVKAVILQHSPFKEGVAYMPVPRCDQCKWWNPLSEMSQLATEKRGDCGLVWQLDQAVSANFGCVRWEAKV